MRFHEEDFIDCQAYFVFLQDLSKDNLITEIDPLLKYWVSIERYDMYLETKKFWAIYTNTNIEYEN